MGGRIYSNVGSNFIETLLLIYSLINMMINDFMDFYVRPKQLVNVLDIKYQLGGAGDGWSDQAKCTCKKNFSKRMLRKCVV